MEEPESQQPEHRASGPDFLTKTRFDEFDLPPAVLAGLDEAGFQLCTPIQAETLPITLKGMDVAGQAQTGTGKTAAFLVTVFTRLINGPARKAGMPSALIVAPTRELALQIYEDAEILGRHTGFTLGLVIGGIDYGGQSDALKEGRDIVIATPGRLIDYMKQGVFKTQQIQVLVIDEADRLLDLGFIQDIRYIMKKLPHFDKRQSMLFSATLSYKILELTYDYMNVPEFISVTPQDLAVDRIEQSLFHVSRDEKMSLLLGILEREDWTRVLIFVNTKSGVEWVARKLQGNGLPAEGITGDLPQQKRMKLMEQFKDDRLKILVATDVASRGIHVEDISHVINYDLPQDVESYVHRIGRTARAGKTGRAISMACEEFVYHLEPLETYLGYQIPVVWPEEDWFKEDKAGAVSIPRKERSGRPGGRPERRGERGRKGAPERGGRPERPERGERTGRGERGERGERPERPARKKIPKAVRPGGIFGLMPGARSLPVAEPSSRTKPKDAEKPVATPECLPAPEPEMAAKPLPVVPPAAPAVSPPVGEDEEPKKKRRRRRRKKKSPAAGPNGTASAEDSPEAPSEADDSQPEDASGTDGRQDEPEPAEADRNEPSED